MLKVLCVSLEIGVTSEARTSWNLTFLSLIIKGEYHRLLALPTSLGDFEDREFLTTLFFKWNNSRKSGERSRKLLDDDTSNSWQEISSENTSGKSPYILPCFLRKTKSTELIECQKMGVINESDFVLAYDSQITHFWKAGNVARRLKNVVFEIQLTKFWSDIEISLDHLFQKQNHHQR